MWEEHYVIFLMTFAITLDLHYFYLVWGEVEVVASHFSGLDNAIRVMGVTVRWWKGLPNAGYVLPQEVVFIALAVNYTVEVYAQDYFPRPPCKLVQYIKLFSSN